MSAQPFGAFTRKLKVYVVRTTICVPRIVAGLPLVSFMSKLVICGAFAVTVAPTEPLWDELSPANAWPRLMTIAKKTNPATRERRSGRLTKSLMPGHVRRTVLKPRAMEISLDSNSTGSGEPFARHPLGRTFRKTVKKREIEAT